MNVENFGERIRALRLKVNKSQTDMATLLHVSQSTYSAIENGREPEFCVLSELVEYFGVTYEYLIDGKTTVRLKNYGDFIEILQAIIDTGIPTSIGLMEKDKDQPDFYPQGSIFFKLFYAQVRFDDETLKALISDWSKTLQLYKDNVIDEELYHLWLQKRIVEHRSILLPRFEGDSNNE